MQRSHFGPTGRNIGYHIRDATCGLNDPNGLVYVVIVLRIFRLYWSHNIVADVMVVVIMVWCNAIGYACCRRTGVAPRGGAPRERLSVLFTDMRSILMVLLRIPKGKGSNMEPRAAAALLRTA